MGRCNFTNLWVTPENYRSQNPHFCKSALSRFDQHAFIALVEKHGIAYHEKTLGQLFCNDNARQIVEMLLAECRRGGVAIQTGCRVEKITPRQGKPGFSLRTNRGTVSTESLVIATGGLSIPKMGATGFGYGVAKQFGLKVIPCRPGLVGLIWKIAVLKDFRTLAGISFEGVVSCRGQSFRKGILFTHRGLSGPAILQISNYWQPGDELLINLLSQIDLAALIPCWQQTHPKADLKTCLADHLPARLAHAFVARDGLDKRVNQLTTAEIQLLAKLFHRWRVRPPGTAGYGKAEVTLGGADTAALSSKTFEARRVPGLYFIGEVVDVTGWLGGFNFQWAWASGYCAGQYV